MEKKRYLINEVAQKLGISAAAIRLYEKKGLFSSKQDPENGYRYFEEDDIYKIWSVAYHRSYGLGIHEIDALKHAGTLEEILTFFDQRKKESMAAIAAEQQRIKLFDFYNTYVYNALRCDDPPEILLTESLHFYDKNDIYTRSGAAFPGASFCYVFESEQSEAEMYSLVYDHNMGMVSPEDMKKELFTAVPFRCVDLVVSVERNLDPAAALKKAKDAAEEEGFTVKPPFYISYLLSCGELDDSKHYFEAMLPVVEK